jgi:hypothetical protein
MLTSATFYWLGGANVPLNQRSSETKIEILAVPRNFFLKNGELTVEGAHEAAHAARDEEQAAAEVIEPELENASDNASQVEADLVKEDFTALPMPEAPSDARLEQQLRAELSQLSYEQLVERAKKEGIDVE